MGVVELALLLALHFSAPLTCETAYNCTVWVDSYTAYTVTSDSEDKLSIVKWNPAKHIIE